MAEFQPLPLLKDNEVKKSKTRIIVFFKGGEL